MGRLEVRLLKHTDRRELDRYLHLYSRCFNPDERVSPRILRWVVEPSPARVNPVHLFAAYLRGNSGFGTRDSRLGTGEPQMPRSTSLTVPEASIRQLTDSASLSEVAESKSRGANPEPRVTSREW